MNRNEVIEAGARAMFIKAWAPMDIRDGDSEWTARVWDDGELDDDVRQQWLAQFAAGLDAIGWRDERAVKAEALEETLTTRPPGVWMIDWIPRRIDALRVERGDAHDA